MNKAEFIFSMTFGFILAPAVLNVHALAQEDNAPKTIKQRAQAWFESSDKKKRRLQMRQMSRALKQPCKYCHTSGFKGYTDRYAVSLEMMALSAEHNLRCDECHNGKKSLTETGLQAQKMQTVSKNLGVECTHCHVPKKKFQLLTLEGEKYNEMLESKSHTDELTKPLPLTRPAKPATNDVKTKRLLKQ